MNLHENKDDFGAAIIASAEYFGIPAIYIEKDYWVTYALRQIFLNDNVKNLAVFKGGTSLSKCYKIINRFSEDIDMVIFQEKNDTGNSLRKRLKDITNVVDGVLSYVKDHPLENKKGKIRKLAYAYDKFETSELYGQVRDQIILEVSSLGSTSPFIEVKINSMIAEFIIEKANANLIEKYGLESFIVRALSVERTFCEKIISLVRFSYTENPREDLSNKIRHTYDLHQMLEQDQIKSFIKSEDFGVMLLQVGRDDDKAIPNHKEWLKKHPAESLFFKELTPLWEGKLRNTYEGTFKDLVIGELPSEDLILKSLELIKLEVEKVNWIFQ